MYNPKLAFPTIPILSSPQFTKKEIDEILNRHYPIYGHSLDMKPIYNNTISSYSDEEVTFEEFCEEE